jgi:uncharacterized membrane protein (UPF0182 family)
MRRKTQLTLWITFACFIVFLILLSSSTGFLEKWLWMKQLGYEGIFWKIFSIKWDLFGVTFGCVLASFWISLFIVTRVVSRPGPKARETPGGLTSFTGLLIAVVPALIFSLVYYSEWDTYLRFRWGGAFGVTISSRMGAPL